MANKLRDWLPRSLRPSDSHFVQYQQGRDPLTLRSLSFDMLDKDRSWIATADLIMDDQAQDHYILLQSDTIPILSDEELVKLVRSSRAILHAKSGFDRLTNFLTFPTRSLAPHWSQIQFQNFFDADFQLCKEFAKGPYEDWIDLLNRFMPYWECENAEGGHIYCLHDQLGHYKIGTTKQLDNRIKQLSTQPPFEIALEFAFKVPFARHYETSLHNKFKDKRLRGEWFSLTPGDLEAIKRGAWLHRSIEPEESGSEQE